MFRTTLFVALVATSAMAADLAWPQFRGPSGRAVSTEVGLPDKIAPGENERWVVDLPGRGLSCAVIADGRIYLTANSGLDQSRLHVLAYSTAGKKLWERQLWVTGQTFCHPVTCMACPTVATDGKLVHALFATGDLMSLTTDGEVRWVRSLLSEFPNMINHVGRSSSPVLAGDVLIVLMENQGESYLLGIDANSGTTKWKQPRQSAQNNWITPLVIESHGSQLVLVPSYDGMTAYEARTGEVKWKYGDEGLHVIPSPTPVGEGELVLAPSMKGLDVMRPGEAKVDVVWKSPKLRLANASPLAADGKVYCLSKNSLTCADLTDGKSLWELRVKGPFWASPVLADGKIYMVSDEGVVTVVKLGKEGTVLSTGEMKEPIYATPAVAESSIFLRSDKHLWCFGIAKKTS
ncbi:MAG: PQQ-binding-like beta-propeller repeat protein [Gemmataceae bacterium]